MADAQGNVRFQDGEATRRLVFGINALCALEDEFGCSVAEIGSRLTPVLVDADGNPVIDKASGLVKHKPPKVTDIRAIFRAGLIEDWKDGEPTHADAGRIITDLGLKEATQILGEAFAAAFPDAVQVSDETKSGNRSKK